jgi:outer membrane protein
MQWLLFILLSLFTTQLFGQIITLSYDDAVALALKQNVSLRKQENEMKIVKAMKAQSIGEMAPLLSADVDAYHANGNTPLPQEARTINTSSKGLNASFGASLNIFSGFAQVNSIKMSNARFKAQQKLIERTSQQVIFDVSSQYLQILLDQEVLNIARNNLETQQLLMEQIETMFEAGNKPKSDLYDQKVKVKDNELLVLQAQNNVSTNKSELAILLQLEPTNPIEVVDPGWDIEEVLALQIELDELYNTSMKLRADLKQFQYSELAAEKSLAISKSAFSPSLAAFYNLSTRYNDQSFLSLEQQLTTDNRSSTYGLSLSIPIYTGLRNRTSFVASKVELENAEIDTENLKKSILNEVQQSYQNFLDLRSAYEVSIARFEAAELALQVQQEKYNLGVGSLVELTNANNNYVDAAAGRASSKFRLLFQRIVVDFHTGTLFIPPVEE